VQAARKKERKKGRKTSAAQSSSKCKQAEIPNTQTDIFPCIQFPSTANAEYAKQPTNQSKKPIYLTGLFLSPSLDEMMECIGSIRAVIDIHVPAPLPPTPARRPRATPLTAYTHASIALPPPPDTEDDNGDVDGAHDASHNRVRDRALVRVGRELQAQAAVHDAADDERAAVPDVQVGDRGAGARLAVLQVVQEAEEGLQQEEADDDGAEDGVRVGVEPSNRGPPLD